MLQIINSHYSYYMKHSLSPSTFNSGKKTLLEKAFEGEGGRPREEQRRDPSYRMDSLGTDLIIGVQDEISVQGFSCHSVLLTSQACTFSHAARRSLFSQGAMLVRSSHPIIQSVHSLLGISPTMHLFTSLTHLHSQFTTYAFHILSPFHKPPKYNSTFFSLFSVVSSTEQGLYYSRLPISPAHMPHQFQP